MTNSQQKMSQYNRRISLTKVEPQRKTQEKLKWFLNSTPFTFFISILTIYTIFAMDIDEGFFNKQASVYFSSVHMVAMTIFIIQISITLKINKDYFWQFYFWIDAFSTLTMVLQLIWIQDLMSSISNIQVAVNFARMTRVSRFAKIGARSSKIIKLLKIFQVMKTKEEGGEEGFDSTSQQKTTELKNVSVCLDNPKISTLENSDLKQDLQNSLSQNENMNASRKIFGFKKIQRPNVDPQLQAELQEKWEAQSLQMANKKNFEPLQQIDKGTNIGETLKYEIQKNIVIMVIGLTMIIPLLSASTWFEKSAEVSLITDNFIRLVENSNQNQTSAWLSTFLNLSFNVSNPIVFFHENINEYPVGFPQVQLNDVSLLDYLRQSEKQTLETDLYTVIYSKKKSSQITSQIGIARSAFITLLMLFALIFFMKDLESYALVPLQKMNKTVERVEKNPFSANYEYNKLESEDLDSGQTKQQEELGLQTNILEKLLIKITSLVSIGVGETPSRAASHEISDFSLWKDDIGVEVQGIFMVVQIAHVPEIISNLQKQACLYMNNLLQIFHEVVIQSGGFIFHQDETYSMVCWKINLALDNAVQQKAQEKRNAQIAFLAYLKFKERLLRDVMVKKYEYLSKVIPNFDLYKVHVGVHFGQAYCGAIGSKFKISLKALGKDVSIAKSLCRAAKKYKLGLLFSSNIYKLVPYFHNISRKIDEFYFLQNIKTETEPTQIYTPTLHNPSLNENKLLLRAVKIKQKYSAMTQSEKRLRKRMSKVFKARNDILKNSKSKADQILAYGRGLFKKLPNLEEWLELWRESQMNYQLGQWTSARVGFENSKEYCPQPSDFPTQMRLEEIGNKQEPPQGWKKQKKFSLFL